MKVALVYDEASSDGSGSWVEAEYESPETIDALLEAIARRCGDAVPVPFGPSLAQELERIEPELAFNIAEGVEGPSRESIAPAVLELLGIPYTGSDGVTLGVSLNKALTKRLAEWAGIPTPPFVLFESAEQVRGSADGLEFPVLLKPNFGGSSVGVGPDSLIHCPAALPEAVERTIAQYGQPCLAERFVSGVDVTVGLLGNREVEILPPATIRTAEGIYSARAKEQHDRLITCPCELPRGLWDQLADWSLRMFRLLNVRDLARLDYVVDAEGRAYFLEINPLPGLSPYYGVYPVLAKAAGYAHSDLIAAIIDVALERYSYARSRRHERLAR